MTSTPGCSLLAATKPALPTKLLCNTFLMKPTADHSLYASWFTTSVMPTNPVTQSPESTAPTHQVIKAAIVRRYLLCKAPQTCTQSGTLWSTNNLAPKHCLFLHPTGIHTAPQRQAYTQLIPWLPKSSTIQIPLSGLMRTWSSLPLSTVAWLLANHFQHSTSPTRQHMQKRGLHGLAAV